MKKKSMLVFVSFYFFITFAHASGALQYQNQQLTIVNKITSPQIESISPDTILSVHGNLGLMPSGQHTGIQYYSLIPGVYSNLGGMIYISLQINGTLTNGKYFVCQSNGRAQFSFNTANNQLSLTPITTSVTLSSDTGDGQQCSAISKVNLSLSGSSDSQTGYQLTLTNASNN